jgi:peroxiredoxin (alkyl hydroperoxide reductase subunit C)
MILVGKKAPNFTARAVLADNSVVEGYTLHKETKGKYAVLFFYPLDFTFVCPTEIISFNKKLKEFEKRNCEVIGISVDSHFSHIAWKNTAIENGGIGKVGYTLVSDLSKQISRDYDVLFEEEVSLRGTFLIDKNFMVRHQVVNDLPIGRSIDETIRTLDALLHFEEYGEVCPAGWNKQKKAMKPTQEGVADYLSNNNNDDC